MAAIVNKAPVVRDFGDEALTIGEGGEDGSSGSEAPRVNHKPEDYMLSYD